MTQTSPGSISITPNSVRKRSRLCCATTRNSPSALKKCSRSIDCVTSSTCAAMPAMVSQSPAVVMVRRPVTKVSFSLRERRRPPAQRPIGRSLSRCGAERISAAVDALEAAGVPHGRADAVEPGALVRGLRRGERRAGQLLGIEAVVHLLRRVAADRQRAGQRLGLERVAEARHVIG